MHIITCQFSLVLEAHSHEVEDIPHHLLLRDFHPELCQIEDNPSPNR